MDRQMCGLEALPSEAPMWFNRFMIYRDLGYKRTLRLAVATERAKVRVISATYGPGGENDQPGGPHGPDSPPTCPDVATIKSTNVPGSWKDAAQRFHWKERAAAYELVLIRKMSEHYAHQLQLTYANKYKRVMALNEMIERTIENSKIARYSFPVEEAAKLHQTMLAYTKQLARLLDQLRRETRDIDDQGLLASIESHALALRQKAIAPSQPDTGQIVIPRG
jgi:hypothetical protein